MTNTIDYTQTEEPIDIDGDKAGETRGDLLVETHPEWCKLGDECRDRTFSAHVGLETSWKAQAVDVEVGIALIRYDETTTAAGGAQLIGDVHTRLRLSNTAFTASADVELTDDDLDMLITFLQRHRERMHGPQFNLRRSDFEAGK